jgi:hypothetical protein
MKNIYFYTILSLFFVGCVGTSQGDKEFHPLPILTRLTEKEKQMFQSTGFCDTTNLADSLDRPTNSGELQCSIMEKRVLCLDKKRDLFVVSVGSCMPAFGHDEGQTTLVWKNKQEDKKQLDLHGALIGYINNGNEKMPVIRYYSSIYYFLLSVSYKVRNDSLQVHDIYQYNNENVTNDSLRNALLYMAKTHW